MNRRIYTLIIEFLIMVALVSVEVLVLWSLGIRQPWFSVAGALTGLAVVLVGRRWRDRAA